MTGIERAFQQMSNATTAALVGQRPPFAVVDSRRLEAARQEALEDEERRFRQRREMRRRMIRYGCE